MDASWRLLYDGLLIKGFLPAANGLPERLTSGIHVADLGCGTGHAINLMAKEYPCSDFVGYDMAADTGDRARKAVTSRIRESIDRIGKEHPALARHFENAIRTGTFCRYQPDRPLRWEL
jgi:SAM-dependent methyltransferase